MTLSFKNALAVSSLAVFVALPQITVAQDVSVEFGGRLNVDYTVAELNTPDRNIDETNLRRIRIDATGKFGDLVSFKIELEDSSGGDVEATDAYVRFSPKDSNFKVTVGQFREFMSLDEQTSSRFSSVIERAAFTDAFGFARRLGVAVGTSGSNYTLDLGVYTENLEGADFDEDGKVVSARATYAPIKTDETVVHLGTSWRYRNGSDATDSTVNDGIRYRQRPFTNSAPSRIIDTGRFAKSDNFFGVETAVIHNRMWAAGEYGTLAANGAGNNPDANFNGFYGEIGTFFGGRKVYKGGKFNRPQVDSALGEGGIGAFSLVARYDSIDLQDEIYTGQLDTIILGADWWPNKYTRFGLNYFDADAENGNAESANGFVARLGFDF